MAKGCSTFALFIICLVVIGFIKNHVINHDRPNPPDDHLCNISQSIKAEIAGYSTIVKKIITSTTAEGSKFRKKTWNALAYFVDTFGNRISGTKNLENSIDFMLQLLKSYELENVHSENVSVPHWVR